MDALNFRDAKIKYQRVKIEKEGDMDRGQVSFRAWFIKNYNKLFNKSIRQLEQQIDNHEDFVDEIIHKK